MITKFNLFEHSSLTPLGVPDDIMKEIQINFEIDSNATWTKMILKKDIIQDIKNNNKSFYLSFENYNNYFIFINDNQKYFKQYFNYDKNGWGSYRIGDREEISYTQLNYTINIKRNIYKLDTDFKLATKEQRNIQAQAQKLEKSTDDFKIYILKHFNSIIKRLYGSRYDRVMKTIASNLSQIDSNATAEEILKFLKDNKKMAETAREYEDARNDEDILRLKRLEQQFNSLTIIDEYLIEFEVGYSEQFHYHLNIKDLINDFGHMYIETAFMYYLYTGKLKTIEIK